MDFGIWIILGEPRVCCSAILSKGLALVCAGCGAHLSPHLAGAPSSLLWLGSKVRTGTEKQPCWSDFSPGYRAGADRKPAFPVDHLVFFRKWIESNLEGIPI